MPSRHTTSSSRYGAIKRHLRGIFGMKKHRIASFLLGHSLIKRKSDVPKAKSGNSSDMVLISPVICPIEQIDTRENESACELGPNFFTQSVSRSPKPQPQPLTAANISLLPGRPDLRATMAQYIQALPSPLCPSWFDLDGRIRPSPTVKVHHSPRQYAHYSCSTLEENYEADDEKDEKVEEEEEEEEREDFLSEPTLFWSVDDEGYVVGNEVRKIGSDSQGSTVEVGDGDKSQFAWIYNRDLD